MKQIYKILANGLTTGFITAISIMSVVPSASWTTAAIISSVMAGAISGLKEVKEYLDNKNTPKGKKSSSNKGYLNYLTLL